MRVARAAPSGSILPAYAGGTLAAAAQDGTAARAAAPVVDLAGGGTGDTGEGRLADAGAGQQGGEFGA